MKTILLASQSPRRSELLHQIGIDFEILIADHEELENSAPAPGPDLGLWVEQAAAAKLDNALSHCARPECIIICADTIVELKGEVMGKPKDEADARRMLRALSGRPHSVLTGVAIGETSGKRVHFHERTIVEFRELGDSDIDGYVASGEPMDKAGAYGIQGFAGAFVSKVDGCYSNVVGLPLNRVAVSLKKDFGIDAVSFRRNR